MLLETLLGPLWVWLVISEAPPFETLLGGATILVALVLMSITAMRPGANVFSNSKNEP